MIKITKEEYIRLMKAADFLERLECAGVDNWDGGDEVYEGLDEAHEEIKREAEELDYDLEQALDDLESVQFIDNTYQEATIARAEVKAIMRKL